MSRGWGERDNRVRRGRGKQRNSNRGLMGTDNGAELTVGVGGVSGKGEQWINVRQL